MKIIYYNVTSYADRADGTWVRGLQFSDYYKPDFRQTREMYTKISNLSRIGVIFCQLGRLKTQMITDVREYEITTKDHLSGMSVNENEPILIVFYFPPE